MLLAEGDITEIDRRTVREGRMLRGEAPILPEAIYQNRSADDKDYRQDDARRTSEEGVHGASFARMFSGHWSAPFRIKVNSMGVRREQPRGFSTDGKIQVVYWFEM